MRRSCWLSQGGGMSRTVMLHTGASMPTIGLGTWQAQDEVELERALEAALDAGYRFIDTAYLYGNEAIVGRAVRRWLDEGKGTREELFISTKLPMMGMRPADVPEFLGASLTNLKLDYVDLYLIHVPFGMLRDGMERIEEIVAGEVGSGALDMDTDHVAIWKAIANVLADEWKLQLSLLTQALEAEVEAGRTRHIGVSNFNERQLARVLDNCTIPPANQQIELHLYLQQPALVAFCLEHGVTVTAYSPLGSPGSTWLNTAGGLQLPDLLGLPEVREIADKYSKKPAQVLLRHIIQKGLLAVPKSTNPDRLRQNIDVYDFELSEEEMRRLDALDRGEDGRIIDMLLIEGVRDHPEYPWVRPVEKNSEEEDGET
ncbi:Aldo-keto reductase family 1 member A1 [Frankliniella fusca]|uniref:Aldo-keto reductase family 1 member A1 n=1 Tax=Frankliniella fusca TaxID=407009 RepID=A0AAE1HRV0_9NEOP|nr:Aldo-keto reductase family 1 member A1 [Frankliniella fusca]